jgi:hypothetical protein
VAKGRLAPAGAGGVRVDRKDRGGRRLVLVKRAWGLRRRDWGPWMKGEVAAEFLISTGLTGLW